MLRLAVLGDPVAHSLSPVMHEAALQAVGMVGTYVARRVDREGMRAAASEMRRGLLDGANITMPHKALAARLADTLTPAARQAGSVNTWIAEGGRILGDTTDVPGIGVAWRRCRLPLDRAVVVLGAGGAAAAALVALAGRDLYVSSRRPEAARTLVDRVAVEARILPWGESIPDAVVVNATPLGMGGESLPPGLVEHAAGLFDMAYGGGETPAVRTARDRGIPVADGVAMLAAQAEIAFRAWTGVDSPPGLMESVARKASRAR